MTINWSLDTEQVMEKHPKSRNIVVLGGVIYLSILVFVLPLLAWLTR